jgi:hypothetical protein
MQLWVHHQKDSEMSFYFWFCLEGIGRVSLEFSGNDGLPDFSMRHCD